jgi:hypothetical protein
LNCQHPQLRRRSRADIGPVTEANIEEAPEFAVVKSLEGKSIAENEINTKTIAGARRTQSTQALPAGNTNEYLGTLLSAISKADPEFAARVGPATLARALATRFSETNSANPTLLSSDAEGPRSSGQLKTFSPYTKTLYSASVPFQGNVTPGFNSTVLSQPVPVRHNLSVRCFPIRGIAWCARFFRASDTLLLLIGETVAHLS